MYTVEVTPAAARVLRKVKDREARARLAAAIDLLGTNPRPPSAKPLVGRPGWRVRVGDYRVLYTINDDVLLVVVIHLGNRRDVYR